MEEELELPYRAEYAKTGRANCKGCKSPIAKGILRLAAVVQSPVFDGKVPHWYHFTCFFGKQRPKTVGDIDHFDSLRWEDQEKIKAKIVNPSDILKGEPKTKAEKRAINKTLKSALKDYKVEYAKSGRAMCRGCELKILKDEVRIAKKDFESESAKMYGGQDKWHHVDCFAKLRTELQFFESGDKLPQFNVLTPEDKEVVIKALPKISIHEIKDEVDGIPPVKKLKSEDTSEDTTALKKQNKLFFSFRDQLSPLTRTQVVEILAYNDQYEPDGVEEKLDHLADMMTFGALEKCSVCKNGKFMYCTGIGYQCKGDLTEWTKCQNVERDPKRKKTKIPQTLADKFEFLDEYKCKVGKRILPAAKPSAIVAPSSSGVKIDKFAPFRNMSCFIIGKTTKTKKDLKRIIQNWGGTLVTKITDNVTFVISNKDEVDKCCGQMEFVKGLNIHVVPENFIDECEKGGDPIEKIKEMSISPWGSDPKAIVMKSIASKSGRSQFERNSKSGSKLKLKVKGGVAVDPDSRLADVASVYVENKDVYSVTLGLSDVQKNKNSYYKLQLLESDSHKKIYRYHLFRSWGRIGTTIGGTNTEAKSSLEEAKELFCELYLDKTGNTWDNRHNFVKKPGFMYPIDIDYGQNDIHMSDSSNVESKLAKPVQDLIRMLFDVAGMKKVMMEFELDLEKLPLGNLSKSQIQKAYAVLSELQQHDGDIKRSIVIDATNRFYTLIPHDFGVKKIVLLDNKEIIQSKLEMLESLMEMEVAYSLLKETKGEGDQNQHPLDAHHAKLKTDIEVLSDTEEYKIIEQYVKNTHAETHSNYKMKIINVFKVNRHNEDKRFKPFKKLHNRKLLWHGSRVTNFAGILSQGLRIAPPEAPVTGYMFGKGVYFADMVSKSANYCMSSVGNPSGLLLLCEVALGDMYERTSAEYIEKLPPNKHSTKGIGATAPDPKCSIIKDGVEIPLGKGVKITNQPTSLLYNEYIVYDVAQIKAQYLLQVEFDYNYRL